MKKKMKKLLAVVLLAAMAITLFPVVGGQTAAYAADEDTPVGDSGVVLTKDVTLENDGTYTIDLTAYATGTSQSKTVEKKVDLDIVLVLDLSSSMGQTLGSSNRITALKNAVSSFVTTIKDQAKANGVNHRIAITTYANGKETQDGQSTSGTNVGNIGSKTSNGSVNTGMFVNGTFYNYASSTAMNCQLTADTHYKNAFLSVYDSDTDAVNATVASEVNQLLASTKKGTVTYYGMDMAENIFANNPIAEGSDRQRVVVLFTDGATDSAIASVMTQANTLKNTYNATVFCVQLGTDTSVTNFLSYISSAYKDVSYSGSRYSGTKVGEVSTYSFNATSIESLNTAFASITSHISDSTTTVTLDGDSVLKDVIAAEFSATNATATAAAYNASYESNGSSVVKGTKVSDLTATISGSTVSVTGFDYSKNFVAPTQAGQMVCVQITGVLPTDAAVRNEAIVTNDAASGIYEEPTDTEAYETFEQPETILTQHSYVIDYAKQTELDGLDQNVSITGVYGSFQKATANTSLTGTYGDTAVSGTTATYTPKTMQWKDYDNIYVFGKTNNTDITSKDANQANQNVWSRLSVIPANNVYYEDSFTTGSSTVGIEFSGNWTTEGEESGNVEHANGTGYAAEQGWEESLADDKTFSDGSAHVSSTVGATATFTFTGKGVDIYSYTNAKSGMVVATLSGSTLVNEDGSSYRKVLVVNNESVSGDYYQIPTLSWMDLDYGTYTVTINVQADTDKNATYYLDGVRVYNPLSEEAEDAVVAEAYADELGAAFAEVRDILVDSGTFGVDGETAGAVFIDYDGKDKGTETSVVGTYKTYGPENEVYLANGQAIIFHVDSNDISVGLKAPEGTATTATVTNGSGTTDLSIASAADLYYEIIPDDDGYVEIKNNGSGLLAVTKIKNKDTTSTASLMSMDYATVEYKAVIFDTLDSVDYYGTVVEEHVYEAGKTEETEQQTTDEQAAEEQPAVEVVISNPQPAATKDAALAFVRTLFAGIRNILGRR